MEEESNLRLGDRRSGIRAATARRWLQRRRRPFLEPSDRSFEKMDNLPYELLATVLDQLHVIEKLKLKTVCQRWKNVLSDLLDMQTCLGVENPSATSQTRTMRKCIGNTTRHRIRTQDILMASADGGKLTRAIHGIFNNCPNLRVISIATLEDNSFDLESCVEMIADLYGSHLQCLSCRDFAFNQSALIQKFRALVHLDSFAISTTALLALVQSCPRLEGIDCDEIEDRGSALIHLPVGFKWLKVGSDDIDVLSIFSSPASQTIEMLSVSTNQRFSELDFCLPQLKRITFEGTVDIRPFLRSLKQSTQLEEAHLRLALEFNERQANPSFAWSSFFSSTKDLRVLSILSITTSHQTVQFLVSHCPRITKLRLAHTSLTNKSLEVLSQLPRLQALDIEFPVYPMHSFTEQGLLQLLNGKSRESLRMLNIQSTEEMVTDKVKEHIMILKTSFRLRNVCLLDQKAGVRRRFEI